MMEDVGSLVSWEPGVGSAHWLQHDSWGDALSVGGVSFAGKLSAVNFHSFSGSIGGTRKRAQDLQEKSLRGEFDQYGSCSSMIFPDLWFGYQVSMTGCL